MAFPWRAIPSSISTSSSTRRGDASKPKNSAAGSWGTRRRMAGGRTARDYEDEVTAASRVGLAELMTALGAYRDALVLIGGWAPYLILESFGEPGAFPGDAFQTDAYQTKFVHVGSIDIDLVVDPAIIDTERSRPSSRPCSSAIGSRWPAPCSSSR